MPQSRRINPRILKNARELREPLTPSEALLWSRLRNRQLNGFKFQRQHPIGKYIVDFACPDVRLFIELDGDSPAGQMDTINKGQHG